MKVSLSTLREKLKRKPKKYDLAIVTIINGLENRAVKAKVEGCHITYSRPFKCVRVTIDPKKRRDLLDAWDETAENFGSDASYKPSLIHNNIAYFIDEHSKLDLSDEELQIELRKAFPALYKFILEQGPMRMRRGSKKKFSKVTLTPMIGGFLLTCRDGRVREILEQTLKDWDFKFEKKSNIDLKLQY